MLCKYICCCLELRNDIPSNMAKIFLVDHVAQPWILAIRTKLLECWKHWNLSRASFECLHDTNYNIPTCSCINELPSPHSTRKSDVYLSHSQLHFYVYLYFLPVIALSCRYFKVVVQTQTIIFFSYVSQTSIHMWWHSFSYLFLVSNTIQKLWFN